MSNGVTLYYPYIHPRDVNAIKAALLYWDKVRRIVPSSMVDGATVYGDDADAQCLVKEGLLVATAPEAYISGAKKNFFEALGRDIDGMRISREGAEDLRRREVGLHVEKIALDVLLELDARGVARRCGDWVVMRDEVATLYMHCLASEMANRIGTPLMTDSKRQARFGETFLFDAQGAGSVVDTLVKLKAELPSPQNLADVPLHRIMAFAEKHGAERAAFRAQIEKILEKASTTSDPNELDDYLADQRKAIREQTSVWRSKVGELGVIGAAAVASLTVPAGFAAAAAHDPMHATMLAGAGVTLGFVSCVAQTRGKLREARAGAPYHYLIRARRIR